MAPSLETVRTILIVEDQDDDVFLMKRALRRAKITSEVIRVEDGQQAVDYLAGSGPYADRASFPMPDLMFLDIKLPGKSGFEVLEWIKGHLSYPPPIVLMLSSSDQGRDQAAAHQLGAQAYAVKPPSPKLFDDLAQKFSFSWPREAA